MGGGGGRLRLVYAVAIEAVEPPVILASDASATGAHPWTCH
jgi:hypothetical protein